MSEHKRQSKHCCGPEVYEICVEGHLSKRWSEWLACMELTHEADGTTTLYGGLPDQTALHGVLQKIRDLNLKLISCKKIDVDSEDISGETLKP